MTNVHGKWIGDVWGTNVGPLYLELQQDGSGVDGVLRFHDNVRGICIFVLSGVISESHVTLKMVPHYALPNVALPEGTIAAEVTHDGSIGGEWTTEHGTAGTFKAIRAPLPGLSKGVRRARIRRSREGVDSTVFGEAAPRAGDTQ